jgi:hypothetical protein
MVLFWRLQVDSNAWVGWGVLLSRFTRYTRSPNQIVKHLECEAPGCFIAHPSLKSVEHLLYVGAPVGSRYVEIVVFWFCQVPQSAQREAKVCVV